MQCPLLVWTGTHSHTHNKNKTNIKKKKIHLFFKMEGTGAVAPWSRPHTAFAGDWRLYPGTQVIHNCLQVHVLVPFLVLWRETTTKAAYERKSVPVDWSSWSSWWRPWQLTGRQSACLEWYTSSNKVTPPNSSQKVLPTGDQAFWFMSHPHSNQHTPVPGESMPF